VAAPTISGFTPTGQRSGATIVITGTNFDTTTHVRFNGSAASFTVTDATHVTAIVPPGGTGNIEVENPGGTGVSTGVFSIDPIIIDFSPDQGPNNTDVTINGTGLLETTQVYLPPDVVEWLRVQTWRARALCTLPKLG
jgi:hypothetical protein